MGGRSRGATARPRLPRGRCAGWLPPMQKVILWTQVDMTAVPRGQVAASSLPQTRTSSRSRFWRVDLLARMVMAERSLPGVCDAGKARDVRAALHPES